MKVIISIAAIIIVLVLLLTSKSYAEIPVLLITFCTAAIFKYGTNYLLGTISICVQFCCCCVTARPSNRLRHHPVPPLHRGTAALRGKRRPVLKPCPRQFQKSSLVAWPPYQDSPPWHLCTSRSVPDLSSFLSRPSALSPSLRIHPDARTSHGL